MFSTGSDPNFFTLKIHHGGMFSDPPRRRYVNGNVSFIDNVDVDLFSIIELNDMVMSIGYSGEMIMYYQYMIPDLDLDNGLRALGGDQDVQGLIKYVLLGHRLINVYIEHEQTKLDTYKSSSGKTCTIIELEDDAPVPKSKVAKQLMLEWNDKVVGESSVNVVGESSTANEIGKNNVPSEFTTEFYSTLDNEDFDPFLGLDDTEVLDNLNEFEQTLEMSGEAEHAVDKGKMQIVDDEVEQEHSGSEYSDVYEE